MVLKSSLKIKQLLSRLPARCCRRVLGVSPRSCFELLNFLLWQIERLLTFSVRYRLIAVTSTRGCHARNLLLTSYELSRFLFQLPLYWSYFGITEFSRSNTGFSTLKKYLIDPVMSWFAKSCSSCLSFPCCQSCRAFAPRTCFKLVKPLSRII